MPPEQAPEIAGVNGFSEEAKATLAAEFEKIAAEDKALEPEPEQPKKGRKKAEPKTETVETAAEESKVEAKAETKAEPKSWVDDDLARLGAEHGFDRDDVAAFGSERNFLKAMRKLIAAAPKTETKAEAKKQQEERDEELEEILGVFDDESRPHIERLAKLLLNRHEKKLQGFSEQQAQRMAEDEFTEAADAFFNAEGDEDLFGKGSVADIKRDSEQWQHRNDVAVKAYDLLRLGIAKSAKQALQQAKFAVFGQTLVERAEERAKKVSETVKKTEGRKLASPSTRPTDQEDESAPVPFRDFTFLRNKFRSLAAENGN